MAGEKNFNIKNGLSVGGVEVINSSGDLVAAGVGTAVNEAIADKIEGNDAPEGGYDFPDATDGVAGLAFIETAVKSSAGEEKWVKFPSL